MFHTKGSLNSSIRMKWMRRKVAQRARGQRVIRLMEVQATNTMEMMNSYFSR